MNERRARLDRTKTAGAFTAIVRSPPAWYLMLVAVEAVVILVGLHVANLPIPGGDGPEYNQLAHNLLFHGTYSSASSPPLLPNVTRAPGYPAVLAVLDFLGIHLGVGQVLMVRIAQFAMVAVTAWLVYAIAREVADECTARVAGLLTASYLPLLGLAWYDLTEVTTCLLTTLVVLLLVRELRRKPDSLVTVYGLGITLAALTYVRPDFSPVLIIVAAALLFNSRRSFRSRERWLRPAIVVGIFLVAIAPWTIRNYDLTGHLVPIAAGTGVILLASADQYAGKISDAMTSSDFRTYLNQIAQINRTVPGKSGPRHDVAEDAAYTRVAREIFATVPFTRVLTSIPKREAYLWQPASFPPPDGRSVITALGWAQYLILIACGLVGALVMHRRRSLLRYWPLWMLAVYLSLAHLVFHVEGRYSIPARPALIVFAALGLVTCFRALPGRFGQAQRMDANETRAA